MPPNTPSPAPGASQPTNPIMRRFVNSAQRTVAGALLPTTQTTDPQSLQTIPMAPRGMDTVDQLENDTEMDTSENRKRGHSSSTSSSDTEIETSRGRSDSLIANTSLLPSDPDRQTRQRTRLSSTSQHADIEEEDGSRSSTPNQRIESGINRIRDQFHAAEIISDSIEESPISTQADIADIVISMRSSGDNTNSGNDIIATRMVAGVSALARSAILAPTSVPTPGMRWDNNDLGLTPRLRMTSPPPIPVFIEDTPQPDPSMMTTTAPENTDDPLDRQSFITSIMSGIKSHLEGAMDRLETSVTIKTDKLQEEIQSVSSRVVTNSCDIHAIDARLNIAEQQWNNVDTRLDNVEDAVIIHEEFRNSINGHVNRLDQALATSQQNTIIQQLLERISQLEARSMNNVSNDGLTVEEVAQYRKDQQHQADNYYMRTLSVKNFAPPQAVATTQERKIAYDILASIGAEDVLAHAERVKFAPDLSSFRVTFRTVGELHSANTHMSLLSAQIKRNGSDPGLKYSMLTPPRFSEARDKLHSLGMELKRANKINRFRYVIHENQLKIRISKPGSPDTLLTAPESPLEASMDIEAPPGQRCPICLLHYNNGDGLCMYFCGHTFHATCIQAAQNAQGLHCPSCRQYPPPATLNNLDCSRCLSIIEQEPGVHSQEDLRLSSRCNHLHLEACMSNYISTLPPNSTTHPGCVACTIGEAASGPGESRNMRIFSDQIMSTVDYRPGFPDFIERHEVQNFHPRGTPNVNRSPARGTPNVNRSPARNRQERTRTPNNISESNRTPIRNPRRLSTPYSTRREERRDRRNRSRERRESERYHDRRGRRANDNADPRQRGGPTSR